MLDGPAQKPAAEPGFLTRAVFITAFWLPALLLTIAVLPRFMPIFERLSRGGKLPTMSQWLLDWCRFDCAWFHLPAFLAFLVPVLWGEAGVWLLRRLSGGPWGQGAWVTVVALAAFPASVLFLFALLAPVFSM
jgi:hypothetical protein